MSAAGTRSCIYIYQPKLSRCLGNAVEVTVASAHHSSNDWLASRDQNFLYGELLMQIDTMDQSLER